MSRKLIIDGNAVYEIDEQCMLRRKFGRKCRGDKMAAVRTKKWGAANKDYEKD
mgnify:CR=1 FL=1